MLPFLKYISALYFNMIFRVIVWCMFYCNKITCIYYVLSVVEHQLNLCDVGS